MKWDVDQGTSSPALHSRCLLLGIGFLHADFRFGSFCDMRLAGKLSFDGPTRRGGVQTSLTQAWTTGFGWRDVATDWSGLRADISAAHRAETDQPLEFSERTLPRQGGRTAIAA